MGKKKGKTEELSYSLITKDATENVRKLDELSRTCTAEIAMAEKNGDDVSKALIAGAAMSQMRDLLTDDVMGVLMPIVGTPLGMKTDRQYDIATVRDVVLVGLTKGARVVGNEINILGGNAYLTREFHERRFRELDGVTDVKEPILKAPTNKRIGDKNYATTEAELEYRLDGNLTRTKCTGDKAIVVIWHKTDRLETVWGKVKKRLYAIAWSEVTGLTVDDNDDMPEAGFTIEQASEAGPIDEPAMDALEHERRAHVEKMKNANEKKHLDDLYARWKGVEEELAPSFDVERIEAARFDIQEAYRERLADLKSKR